MRRAGRVVLVAALLAAADGCSLFGRDSAPDEIEEAFRAISGPHGGCTPNARRADRMARAELPDGRTFELWVAPTAEGETMAITVEKDANAQDADYFDWCGTQASDDGITWLGGTSAFEESANTEWVIQPGRLTAEAAQIRITYPSGDQITADLQVDGYFIAVREIASRGAIIHAPEKVESLDADGSVIAELDLNGVG